MMLHHTCNCLCQRRRSGDTFRHAARATRYPIRHTPWHTPRFPNFWLCVCVSSGGHSSSRWCWHSSYARSESSRSWRLCCPAAAEPQDSGLVLMHLADFSLSNLLYLYRSCWALLCTYSVCWCVDSVFYIMYMYYLIDLYSTISYLLW